jgi:hypothetical protein
LIYIDFFDFLKVVDERVTGVTGKNNARGKMAFFRRFPAPKNGALLRKFFGVSGFWPFPLLRLLRAHFRS